MDDSRLEATAIAPSRRGAPRFIETRYPATPLSAFRGPITVFAIGALIRDGRGRGEVGGR
jgi:hypothetical protein